mmetsp:Transcript_29293/g.59373  ORF Transcript_29293/g.59373 Transcript_29293/m.59373 type:complete len:130 (-) Transcript_29293:56-445(-)
MTKGAVFAVMPFCDAPSASFVSAVIVATVQASGGTSRVVLGLIRCASPATGPPSHAPTPIVPTTWEYQPNGVEIAVVPGTAARNVRLQCGPSIRRNAPRWRRRGKRNPPVSEPSPGALSSFHSAWYVNR